MVVLEILGILSLSLLSQEKAVNKTPPWTRLIRFLDEDDVERYGEPLVSDGDEVIPAYEAGTLEAAILPSTKFLEGGEKGYVVFVKELLSPLTPKDVPIIRCVGQNYRSQVQDIGRAPPEFPSISIKGSPSIAQWNEPIPIPPVAQEYSTEYAGELCFVVGKAAKNVTRESALDYIAGYIIGNDISSHERQNDPVYPDRASQSSLGKGFDKYAPLGPVLVSLAALGSANRLRLQTFVNGEMRQDASTGDMLFNTAAILSFISQGTTIEPGTVVMTGSPSGLGSGQRPNPSILRHNDVVEVRISGLGSMKNRLVFEQWDGLGGKSKPPNGNSILQTENE